MTRIDFHHWADFLFFSFRIILFSVVTEVATPDLARTAPYSSTVKSEEGWIGGTSLDSLIQSFC